MKPKALEIAHFISERYPDIVNFWTAYSHADLERALKILNKGMENGFKEYGWRALDEKPEGEYFEYRGKFYVEGSIEGVVTDTPLAQNYNQLSEEAKQFLAEEARGMKELLPFCKCGKQLNLVGVCSGCPKGNEGYKSKYTCSCGYEEFFKETVQEKINELWR